jgi:nucleoside-diphosphate-sugar epimerase
MSMNVVVGAGGTGVATAELLARAGHDVRLITRRGSGPSHPRIHRIALDATNASELAVVISGASTLFNCAAPPYHQWRTQFPPLAAALLNAAITAQVNYVMLGNLYGYGPVDKSMTEDLPMRPTSVKGALRVQIWEEAKAAHDAGRVRVAEVRASDFIGRGAMSVFTIMVAPKVLAQKPALFPADLDAPHSWTGTVDAARALVAVGDGDHGWGQAWHAPTFARCAGVRNPRLYRMPGWLLGAAALGSKVVRELPEMQYQLQNAFVVDSSRMQREFLLRPTPLVDILRDGLSDLESHGALRGATS